MWILWLFLILSGLYVCYRIARHFITVENVKQVSQGVDDTISQVKEAADVVVKKAELRRETEKLDLLNENEELKEEIGDLKKK